MIYHCVSKERQGFFFFIVKSLVTSCTLMDMTWNLGHGYCHWQAVMSIEMNWNMFICGIVVPPL